MKAGLVLRLAYTHTLQWMPSYQEIRADALRAEEGGFDSLWLYDHLLYRQEGETIGIWECWTILSALAEATQRAELGTLVLCNTFRNPAILAKMAATLDEVSQGRFILGIGAGWNRAEYEAFGLPYSQRVDRFEEALQLIRPLLREGRTDFQGQFYQARDCQITPRGPSPSGPPILVGCNGPRMKRLTARYADQWNEGYFGQPDTFKSALAEMEAACAEVGRDPATLKKTALLMLAFPDLGIPDGFNEPHLTGSSEEIAAALRGYEALGVDQVMFHLVPHRPEAVERAIEAVQAYKGLAGRG